jgi:DNA processing protein
MSDDYSESTKYWLALSSINNIGAKTVQSLIKRFGSLESVFSAPAIDIAELPRLNSAIAYEIVQTGKDLAIFEKFIGQMLKLGIQILCPDNSEYPNLLKQIKYPPTVIYKRGKLSFNDEKTVAIVGTRFPSDEGKKIAERLAEEFVKRGIVVVSGLANGIDTSAHLGALKGKGKTIAILGSGLRNIYPQENRRLAQIIYKKGAVISEYPPNQNVSKGMLIQRNRITSGISLCSILIEPERGSLNTACWALKQNRDIFLYNPQGDYKFNKEFSQIQNKHLTIKDIDDIDIVLDRIKAIDVSTFNSETQDELF